LIMKNRFKTLYLSNKLLLVFLPFFDALSSFAFVALFLNSILENLAYTLDFNANTKLISIIFASVFLLFFTHLNRFILKDLFDDLFSEKKPPFFIFIIAILLSVSSMFLSVKGVDSLITFTSKKQAVNIDFKAKIFDLKTYYDTKIVFYQKQIETLNIQRNKDKNGYEMPEHRKSRTSYLQQIENLEKEKVLKLSEIDKEKQVLIQSVSGSEQKHLSELSFLAVFINVVLILACMLNSYLQIPENQLNGQLTNLVRTNTNLFRTDSENIKIEKILSVKNGELFDLPDNIKIKMISFGLQSGLKNDELMLRLCIKKTKFFELKKATC